MAKIVKINVESNDGSEYTRVFVFWDRKEEEGKCKGFMTISIEDWEDIVKTVESGWKYEDTLPDHYNK